MQTLEEAEFLAAFTVAHAATLKSSECTVVDVFDFFQQSQGVCTVSVWSTAAKCPTETLFFLMEVY